MQKPTMKVVKFLYEQKDNCFKLMDNSESIKVDPSQIDQTHHLFKVYNKLLYFYSVVNSSVKIWNS
jgi:hypothetical protein